MQAVQSSPDLLPASIGQQQQQQQQQQESGSPLGAPLVKIKSLPAHYASPGRQQHLGADSLIHSASTSPVLTNMHMAAAAAGTSQSSRSPLAGPAHDAAAAAASGVQLQQQQHGQAPRGATVSNALRQQLVAAGGRVGVVHLALHATEAGLVAGWQQQLAAVLEPGGLLGRPKA
jgi:hypothetical protein